jgi:ribosomal protein S18 acetylase RimI-like enzyme
LTLRYIYDKDIEQLEELDRKCFPPPVRYNRYALQYYLSLPNSIGLVEVNNDTIIGFIIATISKDKSANIVTIDVEPVSRRCGLGSKLINVLKNILNELKVTKITLQVSEDNVVATKFYTKHGFEIKKRLPMYYPSTDGLQMEYNIG